MEVYLAHSGNINKHGHQYFNFIGVFRDKNMAIKVIKESMKGVDMKCVVKDEFPLGDIYWTEHGMDIAIVGRLEVRELM